jgi:hypothetical protein
MEAAMRLPGYWVTLLESIAQQAAAQGFVITMQTIPEPGSPLAMGNYGLAIDVRDSRPKYTGQLQMPELPRQYELHEIPPFPDQVQ